MAKLKVIPMEDLVMVHWRGHGQVMFVLFFRGEVPIAFGVGLVPQLSWMQFGIHRTCTFFKLCSSSQLLRLCILLPNGVRRKRVSSCGAVW